MVANCMASLCLIVWGILNGIVIFGFLRFINLLRVSAEHEEIGKYIITSKTIISICRIYYFLCIVLRFSPIYLQDQTSLFTKSSPCMNIFWVSKFILLHQILFLKITISFKVETTITPTQNQGISQEPALENKKNITNKNILVVWWNHYIN